jgi:hypothetical protein
MAANDTQQELVRVVFKDTLRVTGVPPAWLKCEVHQLTDKYQIPRMQVHLIMRKWSGQMLRYSMAFQHQMLACLDRYEPAVDHSTYEWVWKYDPQCDVPFPLMPEPQEWTKKLEPRKASASVDFFERRKTPRDVKIPT